MMLQVKKQHHTQILLTIAFMLLRVSLCSAQVKAESIPETEITALREELAEAVSGRSAVEVRRACKGVIRKASDLLGSNPDAANKYALLSLLFEGQKRLLTLETTESNRAALYETCQTFINAPDDYAELRFDADMLLSEKELAESDATVAERVDALKRILVKYRGTPAEWKSLVVGSLVATKLLDFDFEQEINETMAERFGGDYQVITFRRNKHMGAAVEAIFSGTFKTAAGDPLVLPYDLLGFQYIVCFWSQAMPELEQNLAGIKVLQENAPGRLRVLSCNLDSLPDAGENTLRELDLDWTALHLPEGRDSSVFQAYASRDPIALLVNGQGHVIIYPPPMRPGSHGRVGSDPGWDPSGMADKLDDARYLAQLQYVFTGDFLVGSGERDVVSVKGTGNMSVLVSEREAIDPCFVQPPLRYRLTEKDSKENYKKAEALCAAAIQQYSDAPDLWVIRNRRIIALLGLWRLESDPAFLNEAVREANAVLAMNLPEDRDVIARFCMASAALREGEDPDVLLADIIEKTGGGEASASMLLSAAVIALEANARKSHEKVRERFLAMGGRMDSTLWAMQAFLGDRHHRYRNFHASPGGHGSARPAKYAFRDMVSGLGEPIDRGSLATVALARPAGGSIKIPDDYAGEMLGIVFVEPVSAASGGSNLVQRVVDFVERFESQNVKAVVVFLSDDTNLVTSLVKDTHLASPAGLLSGGLRNPLVQKWGILSADRIPNVMLLRPDGTLAWSISGLQYEGRGSGSQHAIQLAINRNIEKVRCDRGFTALEQRNFKEAIKLFDEFEPTGLDYWASDRHQGRALAYMGLKDWDAALREIDAAIARRQDDFKSAMCKCHGIVEMCLTKATILDKLDRTREAAEQRRVAAAQDFPHAKLPPGLARSGVPVGVYYDWLKTIRLTVLAKGEDSGEQ